MQAFSKNKYSAEEAGHTVMVGCDDTYSIIPCPFDGKLGWRFHFLKRLNIIWTLGIFSPRLQISRVWRSAESIESFRTHTFVPCFIEVSRNMRWYVNSVTGMSSHFFLGWSTSALSDDELWWYISYLSSPVSSMEVKLALPPPEHHLNIGHC